MGSVDFDNSSGSFEMIGTASALQPNINTYASPVSSPVQFRAEAPFPTRSAEGHHSRAQTAASLMQLSLNWSIRDVSKFLELQNVPAEVIHRFEEEEINGEALLTLDNSDLRTLGITKLGPRKILLARIQELRAASAQSPAALLPSIANTRTPPAHPSLFHAPSAEPGVETETPPV